MGIISNKTNSSGAAILNDAAEELNMGDIVSNIDDKLYEVTKEEKSVTLDVGFKGILTTPSFTTINFPLDAERVLALYSNTAGYFATRILYVGKTKTTYGTEVIITQSNPSYITIKKLTDDYVLLAYNTGSGTSMTPTLVLLRITGSTITSVANTIYLSSGDRLVSLNQLSYDGTTWRFLAYGDGWDGTINNYMQVIKVTKAGITKGATLNVGQPTRDNVTFVNENTFIFAQSTYSTINFDLYTINDMTITKQTTNLVNPITLSTFADLDVKKIDDSTYFLWYKQNGQNTNNFRIVTLIGTTFTLYSAGLASDLGSITQTEIITSNKILIFYTYNNNKYVKLLTINGTTLDLTSLSILLGTSSSTVATFFKRNDIMYLHISSAITGTKTTQMLTYVDTVLTMTFVADYYMYDRGNLTPFKNIVVSISNSSSAASTCTVTYIVNEIEPSGYTVSNSITGSDFHKKAVYIPF